jgi:hypothetical protein
VSKWERDVPTEDLLKLFEADLEDDAADVADDEGDVEGSSAAAAEGKEEKADEGMAWRERAAGCFDSKEAKAGWADLPTLLPLLHQHAAQSEAAGSVVAVGLRLAKSFISAGLKKLRHKVEG